MKTKKAVLISDLIKAINELPNCPNGFSGVYDKARILSLIEDLPIVKIKV